ncbi:MAG: rhomboid family intramembrane serine protease [Bacilli bacterium]|jgi:rhomboid protease GluP|nr:rhomboid family intramembrane serine protease [Bacilli bacterium]
MSTVIMNNKDEIIMRLVHYFVTEKNYTPIVVNGVKDEIWLENQEGPYKIIRINANYIHNEEQYRFDVFKIRNVMRQIKRKTVSFSMNTLNILLDVNDGLKIPTEKHIDSVIVKNLKEAKKKLKNDDFPDIDQKLLEETTGMDLILNVTKDINEKTAKENKVYESTFKPKKIVITNILILICIVIFFLTFIGSRGKLDSLSLLKYGANYAPLIESGGIQIFRLITSAFLHGGIAHLLFNMYSLFIIGTQIENYVGKSKFLFIYIISAISGNLMSCIFSSNSVSVGASGAIFGLLGALLYFGYHYRLYLGSVLKNQIIPLILLNLLLGFMLVGVDNAAHIGGLIGGYLSMMACGVNGKSDQIEKINGSIVLSIYLVFLTYVIFFH